MTQLTSAKRERSRYPPVWSRPYNITPVFFGRDEVAKHHPHAMLSLSRHASKRIPTPLLRSFAQAVGRNTQDHNPNLDVSKLDTSHRRQRRHRAKKLDPTTIPKIPFASSSTTTTKVAVREDHGLYAFFRKIPQKPDSPELVGEDRYEVVETPEEGQLITGLLFLTRLIFYFTDEGSQAELGRQRNCGIRVLRTFIPYGT